MPQKFTKREKRAFKAQRSSNSVAAHFPGQYKVRPVNRMEIRYSNASASTNVPVTVQEIVTILLAVATETTSAQATPIFASVRVSCIEVWSIGTTAQRLASGATKLVWTGDKNKEDVEISAYGDPNCPAHIKSKPPKYSLSANWQSTRDGSEDTDQLFRVTMSVDSVISLHIEYVLADAAELATEAGTEVTLGAAQVSGVYARSLGATALAPLGWSSVDVASIPLVETPKDDFDMPGSSKDEMAQLLAVNNRLVQEIAALKLAKK